MKKTSKAIIYISVVIGLLYTLLLPVAANGYGYVSFGSDYHEPSFWYFNDTNYYYEKSTRSGSVSGTKNRGGGPGQGK
ncbi:hypothetical protein EYS14_13720 [Alteromonadaceae bacterium M269]|nr:hypothetical protein EYS14_13720 [Alteromonadaceae bacterium M269]